jgi:predicted acyltransferase (DUF342 family)
MSISSSIYPYKPWLWTVDVSDSNFFRSSYINGNLDISGELISRTDASFCGNLAISGSFSTNNAVSVSNNIGMSGIINQMSATPLSGGFVYVPVPINTPNANVAVAQIAILNNLIGNVNGNVVLGNSTLNSNTLLAGSYNYITGNLICLYDSTLNGNLVVGGNLTISSDISINKLIIGSGKSSISNNTLVGGGGALQNTNSSSSQNTGIGYGALTTIISGQTNTAIGYLAGSGTTNAGSSNMTFLGAGTTSSSSLLQYSTVIGYGAQATSSNQIVLGRSTESTIISGDASLNSRLSVASDTSFNGNISITGNAMVYGSLNTNNAITMKYTTQTFPIFNTNQIGYQSSISTIVATLATGATPVSLLPSGGVTIGAGVYVIVYCIAFTTPLTAGTINQLTFGLNSTSGTTAPISNYSTTLLNIPTTTTAGANTGKYTGTCIFSTSTGTTLYFNSTQTLTTVGSLSSTSTGYLQYIRIA